MNETLSVQRFGGESGHDGLTDAYGRAYNSRTGALVDAQRPGMTIADDYRRAREGNPAAWVSPRSAARTEYLAHGRTGTAAGPQPHSGSLLSHLGFGGSRGLGGGFAHGSWASGRGQHGGGGHGGGGGGHH